MIVAIPSPRQYPSAPSSKVLQFPVRDRKCPRIDVVLPEGVAGEMNTRETGRTGCIDSIAGAAELEEVVDAAWDKSSVAAGDEVRIDVLRAIRFYPIVAGDTVEYTDAIRTSGGSSIWDYTSLFNRFIGCHESKSLSGINLRSLTRRDVEEASVKLTRIIEPAAKRGGASVLGLSSWIDMSLLIPAKTWDWLVNIQAFVEKIPICFIVLCAGEAT
ncbi:hypothetical protein HG531_008499 [Fusarium graminearum]|nr:hypothetical protein HG531_008499 [Fusarium graminearum]